MQVEEDDWMADHTLAELSLHDEGISVLGIRRDDGRYIGSPTGRYYIRPNDVLLLYGRMSALSALDERHAGPGGDQAHQVAISEQQDVFVTSRLKTKRKHLKTNRIFNLRAIAC